jgi:hypothetical protein
MRGQVRPLGDPPAKIEDLGSSWVILGHLGSFLVTGNSSVCANLVLGNAESPRKPGLDPDGLPAKRSLRAQSTSSKSLMPGRPSRAGAQPQRAVRARGRE